MMFKLLLFLKYKAPGRLKRRIWLQVLGVAFVSIVFFTGSNKNPVSISINFIHIEVKQEVGPGDAQRYDLELNLDDRLIIKRTARKLLSERDAWYFLDQIFKRAYPYLW